MTPQPLVKMGRWRGVEGAIEIAVPLTSMCAVWYFVYTFFAAPTAGRALTSMEVGAVMGVAVALTSWAMSRQFYLGRRRNPRTLLTSAGVMSVIFALIVSNRVSNSFEDACSGTFGGELVELTVLKADSSANSGETKEGEGVIGCRVGGVVDNPYLVGTVLRPNWDGKLDPPLVVFLAIVALFSVMGFRTVRVRPTQMSFKVGQLLRFAPAAGSASAMGKPGVKMGKVVACDNDTLWGETCGQIYAYEKEWYPGEWCTRCQQAFTPSPRRFTFKVVSLFTGDVDVLNGLERIDTVSWPRGEPIAPDGRISGMERWVTLGTIDFPDNITVAQALALIHEMLPKWADSDEARIKVAGRTAVARASRVSAWIWRGQLSHRLTYARPTTDVLLAIGPQRLRDLVEDASEELWLQLDVGLLPMEIRTGFKKTFIEEGRAPELQNSKFDLWIPVANPAGKSASGGVWVPRIEGPALRAWLSLDQLREEEIKGISIPLPYLRYDPQNRGRPPEGHDVAPKAGSLDMVRYPLDSGGREPVAERAIGGSMSEWEWFEWRQIELLRQECLVLEGARNV
jgi:hypothetical protein